MIIRKLILLESIPSETDLLIALGITSSIFFVLIIYIHNLKRKWQKELHYKLKKELWGFRENRMAVRFEYEYQDQDGQWFRAYGNENWEFDENGLMQKRYASINDLAIDEKDRKLK